jgi:putative hemolysin
VARADLEHVVGIVQTKDLLAAASQDKPLDLEAVARPAVFVPETLPVLKFLESLQGSDVRMALVVDEHGVVQGLVTSADLLGAIAGSSAYAPEDGLMAPVQRDDGSWLIDGLTPLDDLKMLNGAAELAEAANGFSTAAGLVMHELQRIPTVGDAITYNGVTFEVVDMDGRRIDKLLVRVEPAAPPADY